MNALEPLILATVAAALWIGHEFPWHILPAATDPAERKLRRTLAYTYGVSCILGGLALWCYWHPEHWAAFRFAALLAVAAGVGTVIPRILDAIEEAQAKAGDLDDYERKLRDE
jgi:hypothetical protein